MLARRWFKRTSTAASLFALVAACGVQPEKTGSIALTLLTTKGVLANADAVTLAVYDAGSVACSGSKLAGPAPTDSANILLAPISMSGAGCTGAAKWCVGGALTVDAGRDLTWFVSGTKAGNPAFFGCTQHAMDQDPVQISIKVSPYVPGSVCGDGNIIPPKTCDPSRAPVDEACDSATCQTKEVILSNGATTSFFYRGNPNRKDLDSRRLDRRRVHWRLVGCSAHRRQRHGWQRRGDLAEAHLGSADFDPADRAPGRGPTAEDLRRDLRWRQGPERHRHRACVRRDLRCEE